MLSALKVGGTAFITIILLDFIFLGFIANKFYLENLSSIGRISDGKFQPVFWAAAFVYLFLAIGITFFALPRVEAGASYLSIFLTGALLGLLMYGLYDMTNYSTLKDYPLKLALFDMAWGTFVGGAATLAASFVRG